MSLMAGFDLIVEVSRSTVEKLIKSTLQFGGTLVNPPFELQIPLQAPVSGLVSIIVTDLHLDLFGDRGARVTLVFSGGSVSLNSPALLISLLDGNMTVTTEFELVNSATPDFKVLSVDLSTAASDLQFSATSDARITAALAGTPLDLTTFKNLARAQLIDFVHGQGRQVIPRPEMHVQPGTIGSISQGRFERLEVHNLGATSVLLTGMLIPGKPGGDPAQKNIAALTPGHDVAVSIGPDAFHRLAYCPSLADGAKISVSQLPPSCGTAGSYESDGVKLTGIQDTFANGSIEINGTVEKSGTCYEASGTFHSSIKLYLQGSALKSTVTVDPPSVDVDVDWYCNLIGFILGPIGTVISAIAQDGIDSSMTKLKESTAALSGSAGPSFGTGGLSGSSFDQVAVTPEAITLNGRVPVWLPIPQVRGIDIVGSVTAETSTPVSSGTYRVRTGCMHGTYPYVEAQQPQTGTFVAVPTLMAQPINLQWRLEYWEGYWGYSSAPALVSSAALPGPSGKLVLGGVECQYPVPLPQGTMVRQPVHIDYSLPINTVKLKNDATEGCYSIQLKLRATDASGNVAEATTGVVFDGDIVTIGGTYHEHLAKCALLAHDRSLKLRHKNKVPAWVPVDRPSPDAMKRYLRRLAKVKTHEGEQLLAHAKLGHGQSFHRALASRPPNGKATRKRKRRQR